MPGMTPEEIKAGLILRKIKQIDIAAQTGYTTEAVNMVIKGIRKNQKIRKAIAAALEKPVSEIWPGVA
ncbi:MAG: helix-turn-helix domain-containing protein [Sporomusaceae bacterium]|jgi:lambda repressor-like predicted transcriptional regulator|nr:helix-turn-helix domain-containing protein [Sporomusaceae bacterium]